MLQSESQLGYLRDMTGREYYCNCHSQTYCFFGFVCNVND